jgi:NADPH:quinone reductase-like Zn-dependent oxidoreductase
MSLGVRTSLDLVRPDAATPSARAAILRESVRHAGEGRLYVPVARTFPLDAWREALAISQSWQARGKLVLLLK